MKRVLLFFIILIMLPTTNLLAQDESVESDFQSWNVIRFTTPFGEKWSASLQNELRFSDNKSNLDHYIIKLYAHYKFSKKVGLSFGYKYISRPDGPHENDPWTEIVFPQKHNKWHFSQQGRFEVRIIEGIPGIIPRIRYLFNYTVQLGESIMYVGGFGAVRFNLVEKGEGPVAGFEQVRANVNLGFHLWGFARFEIGYLYRFEIMRDIPNLSDHAIHTNLFITLHRNSKKPLPNDHIL